MLTQEPNARLRWAGEAIRTDAAGRYCLNDLHRAADGEKRHGPSYWLGNGQTRELIHELGTAGNPVVALEGAAGGTFVAKELTYGGPTFPPGRGATRLGWALWPS
ncbi:MAG: KilA-N domain-containing protein [Rubrivivax sp.]|nr:KilA-N domain-containing protein [Rubrivivax sp.]